MSKGYKIVTALLVFIILAVGSLLVLNEFEVIKLCKCSNSCPKCEEKKCDASSNGEQKSLIITKGTNESGKEYIVEWRADGTIFVKLGDEEETLASNVTRYYDFRLGISDVCLGNEILVFESNNEIASALDLDGMVCGENIHTIDTLYNVGKYDHLFQKVEVDSNYSVASYSIYAYRNGGEEDISSHFHKYYVN